MSRPFPNRERCRDLVPCRNWEMSHLPQPSSDEIADLLEILSAFVNGRRWRPTAGSREEILWEYAERHGVGGVLGAMAMGGGVLSDFLARQSVPRYLSNSLHHEKSLRVCRELQRQAIAMAIPFTVIKGPALHESVYTDSGIRSHADIDVLVPSRTDALRLIRALGLVEATDRYNSRLRKRLIQSGRVHTNCMGWPVEFMYPIRWPCDPMFSLLERHCDQLLKIPASESMLSVPPPELHLLLLIAHTAIHMCSRWIWYLDLAMLLSRHRERIDLPWIEKELDRLQLLNISAGISQFCRRYIDSRFPILRSGAPGWNTPLQQVMVSHQQVQGLISVYHSGGWRRYFTGFLSPTRYFLITDPLPTFSHGPSAARTWLVNRVFYTLRLESSGLHQLLDRLLMYLGGILPMVFRWYRKRHAPIVAHRVDDAVDIRPPASSGGRN